MSNIITSLSTVDDMARLSKAYSQSTIIPAAFQGNAGSCMVAITMAQQLNCNPLLVMQNIYEVHGRWGYSGQLCIATLNKCPQYRRIEYQYLNGKDHTDGMRVVGHRVDGETDIGAAITPAMVQAEGWSKNPKWKSMPDQMYRYRSASFFVRAFCPEILMGFQTTDELADLHANGTYRKEPARNVTPAPAAADEPQVIEAESAPQAAMLFTMPEETSTPRMEADA
jgi:hypothetical protein